MDIKSMQPLQVAWVVLRNPIIMLILVGFFYVPVIDQPRYPEIAIFSILGWVLFIIGVIVMVFMGIELVRRANFYVHKPHIDPAPKNLIRTGLYKFVRHPIYTGCMLTHIGWCLIMRVPYCLLFPFPLFTLALWLKARQEERDLVELFGDEYVDYQGSVGMILPRIRIMK